MFVVDRLSPARAAHRARASHTDAPRGTLPGRACPPCTGPSSGICGSTPGVGELLARLRRATGAQAYYTAYRGGLITVVDSTAPVTDTADPFTPGPELRAHATAHGKALLAGLPRPVRRRYLADHGMARFTDRTITAADRFEAELARVRGQGFAVSIGEADPAYTCLAVALPGPRADGRSMPCRCRWRPPSSAAAPARSGRR